MKNWKRPLVESLLIGAALTLTIIFFARQQIHAVLDWIWPVFYVPIHGSALISGNTHEPSPWLMHTVLFLQCCLAAFVVGWLVGRYRSQSVKA